jgi:hypothetical protein
MDKTELIKVLLSLNDAKLVAGNNELIVHCPTEYCKTHHQGSKPHFYISLQEDNIFKFNCKHCDYKGILTPYVMHQFGIERPEIDEFLISNNKSNLKNIIGKKEKNNSFIIPSNYTKQDIFKLNYLQERTGIDFTKKENIINYRIIIDLNRFLLLNNINLTTMKTNIKDEISNNFVGFLSSNDNVLNLRNIKSRFFTQRYINIKIDKTINSPFLYIPPTNINILFEYPRIVLSEGAFDILCIKNQYYPKDSIDTIFAACGAYGSYKRALIKLIKLTGFIGGELLFYSDKDVKLSWYENKFKDFKSIYKIKVIYNKFGKDFGRIREKMQPEIFNI